MLPTLQVAVGLRYETHLLASVVLSPGSPRRLNLNRSQAELIIFPYKPLPPPSLRLRLV